jgi:phage N-6-adenine-methyltransferase
MFRGVLFSSTTDEWATPRKFFEKLDRRYHFTLDPCCTPENALCSTYFTKADDGLVQDWGTHRVFCNPPYGGRAIGKWARKCFEAAQAGALVVMLVHARTDTKWYHDWVQDKASEIKFLRGRLRFGDAKWTAPFPSMLAVYLPRRAVVCPTCGKGFVARRNARTCSNACRQAMHRKRNTLNVTRAKAAVFEFVDQDDVPIPDMPILCERCFEGDCKRVLDSNKRATIGGFLDFIRRRKAN